jgi:ATP-binding cassette, subfamily B, bacterial CvaB/MchF/RaxB
MTYGGGLASAALSALRLGWGRSTPMLLQTEEAECGLACLAMVATHHGLKTDLPTLRRRFSVSLKGSTMMDLVRMAGQMQMTPRALRAELEHVPQLNLPCVLHWDLNHFVVLTAVGRKHVVVHDPARGIRRMSMQTLSGHFTGVALELTPSPDFQRREERQSVTARQLLGQVTGLKRSLFQILVLALGLEVFMLLSPFFMQWVVDSVLVSADRELLVTLGLGFTLLVLIQVVTGAIRSWAVLYLSSTLNLQWLSNVFAHLMRLPVVWFDKRHTGDVMSRFHALDKIQQTLTTSFIEVLLDGLLVVLTLAMMAFYSLTLTGIALAAVLAYGVLRWAFFRPLRDATEESIVHDARVDTHFLESLRGVQSIKLFNRQEDRQARFMNRAVDALNAHISMRKLDLTLSVSHKLVFGLERVAVIWVGALLVLDRSFSVGMLFAFFAYKEQFALRVSGLIDKLVELRMLKLQGERLADIVLTPPEAEVADPVDTRKLEAKIELAGIGFRYSDGEPWIIEGLNLSVEQGESVAIVGPSGGGKTTLMKIMLGTLEPLCGGVSVGGVPLARLGLRAWRDMIGTVMQDDQLFGGSIIDNISFFAAEVDMKWVEECAHMAAVHDEIEAMPMGFHTLIGDMGTSISGGQKQRILLARALYKRPRILFLDEATSALDVDRERLVNQAVRQLQLTRIIIAHRPETIATANRVIVLHEGQVTQDFRSVANTLPQGGNAAASVSNGGGGSIGR